MYILKISASLIDMYVDIQGGAKVGLQLWVRESLFLYYYLLIIVLFSIKQVYT